MASAVDILEERVVAAAELIASLRTKVLALERELMATRGKIAVPAPPSSQGIPQSALLSELERLRAERVVVRESIRGLLQEIDRIAG